MKVFRSLVILLILGTFGSGSVNAEESQAALLQDSHDALKSYLSDKKWEGIKNVLGASKGVVISPHLVSGALILGYEEGSALFMARHGEEWSDPVFVSLSLKSVGFQVGVKESEVLMMILTREAVDQIVQGLGRVAGTGGFALGGLGVGGAGAGGLSGGMQILTVATSEGVALGSGLADMNVAPLDELNSKAYGTDFDMGSVLAAKGGNLEGAQATRDLLSEATKDSWNQ